jgi:hypothetical protein
MLLRRQRGVGRGGGGKGFQGETMERTHPRERARFIDNQEVTEGW